MRGWQVLFDQIGSFGASVARIADSAVISDNGRQASACRPQASAPVAAPGQAQQATQQRNRQNDVPAIDLGCVPALAIAIASVMAISMTIPLREGQQRDKQDGSNGEFSQHGVLLSGLNVNK
jgi:hypothetical protein